MFLLVLILKNSSTLPSFFKEMKIDVTRDSVDLLSVFGVLVPTLLYNGFFKKWLLCDHWAHIRSFKEILVIPSPVLSSLLNSQEFR